jgi:hypothetical protein
MLQFILAHSQKILLQLELQFYDTTLMITRMLLLHTKAIHTHIDTMLICCFVLVNPFSLARNIF